METMNSEGIPVIQVTTDQGFNYAQDMCSRNTKTIIFKLAITLKSDKKTQKLQALLKIRESKFKQIDAEVAKLLDKIKKWQATNNFKLKIQKNRKKQEKIPIQQK